MIVRLATLGVLVAAIGCGGSTLGMTGNGGGAAGGASMTGAAGTTGTGGGDTGGTGGGVSGTGGTLRGCTGDGGMRDGVGVAIVGTDGQLVASAVSAAAVTVASLDSCAAVTCPETFSNPRAPSVGKSWTRMMLTGASSQQWTLYLLNTTMPTTFVAVGDAFDLTVDAVIASDQFGSVTQTVVLAHGSDLALFGFESSYYSGSGLPNLSAFQIDVTAGADFCEIPISGAQGCGYRWPNAVVTVAGQSATLHGGETARRGWLSFTNGESSRAFGGFCDAPSSASMGGFRVP